VPSAGLTVARPTVPRDRSRSARIDGREHRPARHRSRWESANEWRDRAVGRLLPANPPVGPESRGAGVRGA